MSAVRLPGPLCAILGALEIDVGTLCRAVSPFPFSAGLVPPGSLKKASGARKDSGSAKGIGALSPADFEAAAKSLGDGIDARLIQAFAEVESGGKSGFGPAGLPVIAFEGHFFRKFTGRKYDTDYPLLSYPYKQKAGPEWKKNNKNQTTAWETLNAAIALDEAAALKSCSWGMFQVMGSNYSMCEYATVNAFVAAMKAGERGQLGAFVGYCKKKKGMIPALRAKNFATMAQLYNGNDYGDYDKRIEKAYKKRGGK